MVIEELMWLRNEENKPITFDDFKRKLRFDAWIKDPSYDAEVKFFLRNLTTAVAHVRAG